MRSAEEKTVLLHALDGDVEGLKGLLATDSKKLNILWEKDEVGRNALFAACTLGRSGIVRELVQNGANVNEFTAREDILKNVDDQTVDDTHRLPRYLFSYNRSQKKDTPMEYMVWNNLGYSPLHCSAMWGQLDTLKTLVELNADFQATNFRGEKAVDVARRYDKLDCAEYLAWAEAKQSLQALIQEVRDTIADQEKIQGKLSKVEKNMCINICSSKSNWIHNTKNATIQDFIEQEKDLEDVLAPILLKINIKSEATTKTRKQ